MTRLVPLEKSGSPRSFSYPSLLHPSFSEHHPQLGNNSRHRPTTGPASPEGTEQPRDRVSHLDARQPGLARPCLHQLPLY